MTPKYLKNKSINFNSYLVKNANLNGIGYWLCLGETNLDHASQMQYYELVSNTYEKLNVEKIAKKLNLNLIILKNSSLKFINSFEKVDVIGNTKIFKRIQR